MLTAKCLLAKLSKIHVPLFLTRRQTINFTICSPFCQGKNGAVRSHLLLFAGPSPPPRFCAARKEQRKAVNTRLAKATQVPVVGSASCVAPSTATLPQNPALEDLRQSGQIEQDAHAVFLLPRPKGVQPAGGASSGSGGGEAKATSPARTK
jgi:hypothetical protein